MRVQRSVLRPQTLIRANTPPPAEDPCDLASCRATIRDNVIRVDNHVVGMALAEAGALGSGILTAGGVLGMVMGRVTTPLGLLGVGAVGAAFAGCLYLRHDQSEKAQAVHQESVDLINQCGCYTMEELYEMYRQISD